MRHEKLNLPKNPCEPDPDYNFGHCVDKSVMARVGCQPKWSRVSMEDMPLCDNSSLLWNYHVEYLTLTATGSYGITEMTKCLLPCSFMEYKVATGDIVPSNYCLLFSFR